MRPTQDLLFVTPNDLPQLAQEVAHRLTMLTDNSQDCSDLLRGTTVWGALGTGALVYWPWSITECGAACLSNPLAIRSNLLFTDAESGRALSQPEQMLHLNQLVHDVHWQEQVMAHVRRLGLWPRPTGATARSDRRTTARLAA